MHISGLFTQALFAAASTHALALPNPTTSDITLPPPATIDALDARAVNYIDTVNRWRTTMGVPTLKLSTKLQSNVQDTVNVAKGKLIHKLNPGSRAQVLAPGQENEFERVFVGGWICEVPSLIQNKCSNWSKGWAYNGQTAHAQYVSSKDFTHVGCAWSQKVWGCDFGMN